MSPPAPPSSFLFSCSSLLISTSSPAKYHTTTSFNTSNALHPPPAFYFHVLHCSSQHHPLPNTTPRQALTLLTPCTPLQLSIFMLDTALFKHFRFFMSFTAHLNIIPCRIPRSTSSQHTLAFHPAPPSRFLFSCSALPIEAFWIFHSACTPIRKNTYQKKLSVSKKIISLIFFDLVSVRSLHLSSLGFTHTGHDLVIYFFLIFLICFDLFFLFFFDTFLFFLIPHSYIYIYIHTPKNHFWCFNLNISWSNHPQPWRGSLILYFFPMENHNRQQH